MSPDYPPQTIVDSPWKEGYLLVREESAFALSRIDHALSASFLPFLLSSLSPLPSVFFLLLLSFFFFFILWKGYRFEGIKGKRESKGPFVEIHLWLGGDLSCCWRERSSRTKKRREWFRVDLFVEALFFFSHWFRDDQRWIWYYKYQHNGIIGW